jgi:heat shock protein HslJ
VKFRTLLLPLALAACAQPPVATSPAPSAGTPGAATVAAASAASATNATSAPSVRGAAVLSQYHWQLNDAIDRMGNRIDALFVRPKQPLQLDFSADRLNVVNACNNLGAGYSVRKGRLQIGPMVSTMMACHDPALSALEDAISQRLRGSVGVNLLSRDNTPRLQLVTDSGDTLSFTGVATAETRYGGPGERAFLEVAAQTVPCNHPLIPGKQCLLVRERHFDEQGLPSATPGEWQPLNQDIEGYTHTPGIRNVLRVKRFNIANPPADGPAVAYVLDLVVESEQVSQ